MRPKMRYLALLVMVAVLSIGLPSLSASADDGIQHGKTVFGDDFVLASGEELQGDLAVFGGDVTLLENSTLAGNALVMGGSISVAGRVDGDIAVFGGDAQLDSTCEVDGDIVALGGSVTRREGAVVRGTVSEGFSFDFIPRLRVPAAPRLEPLAIPGRETAWRSWWSSVRPAWTWFTRGVRSLVTAIVLAMLAVFVVALCPKATQRIAETVQGNPGATVGMGLLTLLVVPGLLVLLTILIVTACLVPFLAVAAGVAFLFGWIGLGLLVGQRLMQALKVDNVSALWQTALGVAVITLVGAVPCLGWLAWVVGGAFGLGAVVLTRFGTQRYWSENEGTLQSQPSPVPTEPQVPAVTVAAETPDQITAETEAGDSGAQLVDDAAQEPS